MRTTAPAEPKAKKPKPPKGPKVPKFWRDIDAYRGTGPLVPAKESPICDKCGLDVDGCSRAPYMQYTGADQPTVTVVFESVSRSEDEKRQLAGEGSRNGLVRQHIEKLAAEVGIDPLTIRYAAMTRCANTTSKKIEYKTRGNWCRAHLVRDLAEHKPRLIIPVGTAVLGRLCHKSSAQDWAGRVLTYRGWPDDWLTNKVYDNGSPFTGAPPTANDRTPMVPIQAPYIVWATQNPHEIQRWRKHIRRGLELARDGTAAMSYDRPWFNIATTVADVIAGLRAIPDGVPVTYDLETKGLLPFAADAGIVFAMFRWRDRDGMPRALGFPWLFEGSPITPADALLIVVEWLRVLYNCKISGHQVSFDLIHTFALLPGVDLVRLTASLDGDTRQMIYAWRQTKESLGLERVAYDWCPDMAGYEEEFELLKRREPALLDPAEKKGGHYANVPRPLWDSHLKPYVMGDVEVAFVTKENLDEKLRNAKRYAIPLADPNKLGSFRDFTPPSRHFMYRKFMLPAQRVLTRVMARGLHVDMAELEFQENMFPKLIREARDKLRVVDPRVISWCQQSLATEPGWELDLESRDQLKAILFDILQLPVTRLTESGQKAYGEDVSKLTREQQIEYAAIDKFTLNGMVAENPSLAPLQDYRKLHKAYTAFVRSMRNIKTEGIDKKEREKDQYLQADGRVHANFNQCGTRSGRLGCSQPNLQQLPRDAIIKRMYASRFGPKDGCIYQADLSQIELRLLAAGCGDPLMVRAYRDKIDLHSLTTSRVFNIPYDHFEKSYMADLQKRGFDKEAKELNTKRSIGKTTNFLTGYGGGAYGLQTTLAESGVYLSLEECERIVDALFDTYPGLRRHIGLYKRFILENACAVSITGRVRVFEDVFSEDNGLKNKALRSGFNHLIQSTASDLMLICMAVIEYLMREAGLQSILVSTVHDSIVIDALRSELPIVNEICDGVINHMPEVLAQVMGADYDVSWLTIVPIEGDAEVGANYLDARKIVPDNVTGQVDWDALFAKKAAA